MKRDCPRNCKPLCDFLYIWKEERNGEGLSQGLETPPCLFTGGKRRGWRGEDGEGLPQELQTPLCLSQGEQDTQVSLAGQCPLSLSCDSHSFALGLPDLSALFAIPHSFISDQNQPHPQMSFPKVLSIFVPINAGAAAGELLLSPLGMIHSITEGDG